MKYAIDTSTTQYKQAARALRLAYGLEAGPPGTQPRPTYLGKLVLEPSPREPRSLGVLVAAGRG